MTTIPAKLKSDDVPSADCEPRKNCVSIDISDSPPALSDNRHSARCVCQSAT